MWIRTAIGFLAGLFLGLFVMLLYRGSAANRAAPTLVVETIPQVMLDDLRLNGVPLDKALDAIADKSHIPIVMNRLALGSAGIELDTPVHLKLQHVSLTAALDSVLAQAGGSTQLSYFIKNGVITVSTADQLNSNVIARIYDVKDLLDQAAIAPPAIRAMDGVWGGGAYAGIETPNDSILLLVTNTIAPDTWRDMGGSIGSAWIWGGRALVVVTTPQIQDQVARLLVNVRNPLPLSALHAMGRPSSQFGEVCIYDVHDLVSHGADPAQKLKDAAALIHTIESTIEAASWMDAGGTGSCSVFEGRLVVNTTPKIQAGVADLLSKMRERETVPAERSK